jgi:hypothetical protein
VLLAALAGSLPIGYAVLRRALAARQIKLLVLLAVPVLALAVVIGYSLLYFNVLAPHPSEIFDVFLFIMPSNAGSLELFSLLWSALLVLAAIASAAAVFRAVSRVQVSERLFRFALIPIVLTTAAMAVVLVSAITSNLNAAPGITVLDILSADTDKDMIVTLWWLGVIDLMAFSAGIAIFAILRYFLRRATPLSQAPAAAS